MLLHSMSDMGFPEKEREAMQWPIAGVSPPKTPLRPINTRPSGSGAADAEEECSSAVTTPTAKEARIPEQLLCPPAPRKRRPSVRCQPHGGVEFFSCPPDLEALFMRRSEKAK